MKKFWEGLKIEINFLKSTKKSKSSIDNTNYKKARNQLQGLIKGKKRNFITQKLTKNISKARELWKSLKNLGLPSKNEPSAKICLGSKEKVSFDNQENAESFKDFYENLATNLVNEFPLPTNKFVKENIKDYYKPLNIENKNFTLKSVTNRNILNLLEQLNPKKSVGIDNLGGKFIRDGAKILAKPIT